MRIAPLLESRSLVAGLLALKLGKAASLAMLLALVAACGGGGASSNPNTGGGTSTIINTISPAGVVVSTPTALKIFGANFSSGMTIRLTSSLGTVDLIPTATTATSMDVSVTFNAVPTGNYATLSVLSASGGTTLASTVVGVAGSDKNLATHIQPIFDSVCVSCHSGPTPSGGLDLSGSSSAAALINANSAGKCSSRFRVTPGDPRRASSVLIDKIQARPTGMAPCDGQPMPPAGFTLSAQQIQDIVDWVAGGAW